jgi:1,4-alpha-glucan branching enzyme
MAHLLPSITESMQHFVEINEHNRLISFYRDGYLFAFNFSPTTSLTNHQLMAPTGSYEVLLSTDDPQFGGQGRIDHKTKFLTEPQGNIQFIRAYLPARTATVFQKID